MIRRMILISTMLFIQPFFMEPSHCQQDVFLAKSEIQGYTLEKQASLFMEIGDGKYLDTTYQTWVKDGVSTRKTIYINYGIFSASEDAFRGMLHYKDSLSELFNFGSYYGGIVGDVSWFPYNWPYSGIIFLRGNLGIHITGELSDASDSHVYQEISAVLSRKIQSFMNEDIINTETLKKKSQIDSLVFHGFISDVVKMDSVQNFSSYHCSDSKWFISTGDYYFGRKIEWINETGAVIGIDIAEFETPALAEKASLVRIQEEFRYKNMPPVSPYEVGIPSSIDSLVEKWNSSIIRPLPISAISHKGNYAIHVYHYNQAGNDLLVFSTIVKEVSKNINFLTTSVHDSEDHCTESPKVFTLHQNAPNPFNPATSISFSLAESRNTSLVVYDALGRSVRRLANGTLPAGTHVVRWDGRDDTGAPVSSGVYLYRLTAGGVADTRRMTLVR